MILQSRKEETQQKKCGEPAVDHKIKKEVTRM